MKEILFGSCQKNNGYGVIAKSAGTLPQEEEWVCSQSVYQRIVSKDESPISYGFSGENGRFISKIYSATDYSGRASHLASFLQVNQAETELFEDGPVWLLEQYSFTPFNEYLQDMNLDHNLKQPLSRFDPFKSEKAACPTWSYLLEVFNLKGLEFAAGCANLLLAGRTVVLLYSKEQRNCILPLFRELYTILPAKYRWKIPFNTYVSQLGTNPGLCGVLIESSAVQEVQRNKNFFWLDLTTGQNNLENCPSVYLPCFTSARVQDIQSEYAPVVLESMNASSPIFQIFQNCEQKKRILEEELAKTREDLEKQNKELRDQISALITANKEYLKRTDKYKEQMNSMERDLLKKKNELTECTAKVNDLKKQLQEFTKKFVPETLKALDSIESNPI